MSTHLVSASAQIRSLAKAVSAAFAASALTEEEKNPGRVELTDLPWAAPPLECHATLGGAPLMDYLNVPMNIDERLLRRFWSKTLEDLWLRPSSSMRRGVYANCSWGTPRLRLGQRAFLFSVPPGFPAQLDMSAGAMFSIEVARAAASSLPVLDVVSDEDNYYAITAEGSVFGVKNGRPACASSWDTSVAGMVPDMLATTRGEPDFTCRFDQLAALRSVLHQNRKLFPEFQGLDYALQALRLLTLSEHCPELVTQMRMAPLDLPRLKLAERALRDALSIIDDLSMSDRVKLQIWHNALVPDVISATKFKQHIWAGAQFPFSLTQAKLENIRQWLEGEYRALPASIQQEDVCKLAGTL